MFGAEAPMFMNSITPNYPTLTMIHRQTKFYIKSGRSVMMPSTLSAFSRSIIGRSFTPRLLAPQTKSGSPIFSAADFRRE